jgi:hypothetical protein
MEPWAKTFLCNSWYCDVQDYINMEQPHSQGRRQINSLKSKAALLMNYNGCYELPLVWVYGVMATQTWI